jgi:hypothetical protein
MMLSDVVWIWRYERMDGGLFLDAGRLGGFICSFVGVGVVSAPGMSSSGLH